MSKQTVGVVVLLLAGFAAAAVPRFPGGDTTVVVNRTSGQLAVAHAGKLEIFENADLTAPLLRVDLPGTDPRVLEFRGSTLVYLTHQVRGMARVLVALMSNGRERLAWPNEGLYEGFPDEDSRLTLDGKGLVGDLVLDQKAREFFGLPESIPLGAGVVATYRFAGEKLLARASEIFLHSTALTPDDLLITLRGGGMLRYRSPAGVAWKREDTGGSWRITDVDGAGGTGLAIDGKGALVGLDLETGEQRWRWAPRNEPDAISDARLLHGGDVLALLGTGAKSLLVLDPRTGEVVGKDVLALLDGLGVAGVHAFWSEKVRGLTAAWELPAPSGIRLLVRAPDGWYELQEK